jgi:predicted dehydrogenase
MRDEGPLRLGVLGAARITPMALLAPARRVGEATIVAVAARDPERARRFARRHDVPRVCESYEALLADPEVDAIYNPLPNSLHAQWTMRALAAGKHVLCEKPFASNAAEAEDMAAAARRSGLVLMEAFHYRYHALFERTRAIVRAGELGRVTRLQAHFCIPLLRSGDIRYRADLAGGALMDTGCYAVHWLRHTAEAEPTVERAAARWTRGGVDRWLEAYLSFPGGRGARLTCALASAIPLRIGAGIDGDAGRLRILNFVLPHFHHRLTVTTRAGRRRERVAGEPTYDAQLRAFVAAVRHGAAFPTTPADAVANMRVIDAIYAAARSGTPPFSRA